MERGIVPVIDQPGYAYTMLPSRLKSLFSQLPAGRAFAVSALDALRKVLDPYRAPTYAQIGEDRLIWYYLANHSSKFYVDIGSHDPARYSNTYHLYQQGWRGLCVDGNPRLIEAHRRARPNDNAICMCVGESDGPATFILSADAALSHLKGTTVPAGRRDVGQEHSVEVRTLGRLFEENCVPERFGLLSIDIEGADFMALKSFDIDRFRPHLVVIEIHGLSLIASSDNQIVSYMTRFKYELVGYSECNAFFLDTKGPVE